MPTGRDRRLQAADSANRLLLEAGIDQQRQIDVFALIESLGIWLAFFPLDNLLGAYLPEGTGGILITTERSIPIQRYTAAHELGHWRLDGGNDLALDTETEVLGRTSAERETLAQFFAAALLMPPPLVNCVLQRRRSPTTITPGDVYALAREAGVSFKAATRQLHHLDYIAFSEQQDLLAVTQMSVKTEIGAGRRPEIGTADVWPVDQAWDGHQLNVRPNDELVISLPEDRSTGYRWAVLAETDQPPTRPRFPEPPPCAETPPVPRDFANLPSVTKTPPTPPAAAVDIARSTEPAPPRQREHISGGRAEVVGDIYLPPGAKREPDPSTRRSRRLARLDASTSAAAVDHARSDEIRVGGVGRRVIGIRLHTPGETQVRLILHNAYDDPDPIEEWRLTASVETPRGTFELQQVGRGDDWVPSAQQRRDALTNTPGPKPPNP